ncbi:hypothetical protein TNCV_2899861 [Trichonephila clavipes]|nr:hypothetical protein TNCV_2899861 [Trichonephila clavipes]
MMPSSFYQQAWGLSKSRQDDLKYCKIREETNGMNFNNFFERATALKTILPWKTTLSGRSHQSTHPGKLSFPEFDLNKFSSLKSFCVFDKQSVFGISKDEQCEKK